MITKQIIAITRRLSQKVHSFHNMILLL